MRKKLIDISWEDFQALPINDKVPYLSQADGIP